ncbi:MAG TPA: carboxypeptidase regulatory-like domain-containing protein [Terriglobia bacterium]
MQSIRVKSTAERRVSLVVFFAAASVFLALAFPGRTFGQAVYGSIVGSVTDAQGAAIPGAKVTITNLGQGVNFSATTNESGNYEQQSLIVGNYKVKVEAQGFQTFVQPSVQVSADVTTQVNAALQLGQMTQTVTVTAGVPVIQTEKTDVASIYSERSVKELPILNRNFSFFELYTPGAVQLQWQHAASENPQGSIQMLVNGQEFGGTDYQLDGTDNHDVILGIMVVNPSLDSVSEVKVTTADQSAEFPQADAGVVTAQTKSGTNNLHGSAFGFRRTDATEARDPFANSVINPETGKFLPRTLWDQFGGSLGGPIKKDKTFIFGDYQGSRQRNGGSIALFVPTAAERAGDLSSFGINIYDPYGANGAIVPPAQRTQFAGNMIPSTLLTSQAQKLLASIPLPNVPGAASCSTPSACASNNYNASGVQLFDTDAFDVRADQYQTEKLHLFGRYSFQRYYQQSPGAFGNDAGGPNFNGIRFSGASDARTQSIATGFDYAVSPSLITDFRFGFFRYRVFVNPNGLGTTPAADAGIPGLNTSSITSGMPYFDINGTGGFSFGYALGVNGCNCPLNEQEQQFQFVNNWTSIKGNHTFKFGADIRRAMNLRVPSDSHRAGQLFFGNNSIYLTSGAAGGGLGLADFLLGEPNSFSRYVSNTTDAAERQTRMFYYGQDTWRMTPKLTFNYGLRWEIMYPQTVTCVACGGWVNPYTGETIVAGETPGTGWNGGIHNSFTNFGPVAGIAYQLNPKTILRLGYGRDFDVGLFGSVFGHTVTQNVPVLAQQSISPTVPYTDVFNLATGPPALDPNTILTTTAKGITGLPLYPGALASPHVLPLRMRLPTVDSWNITLQRELTNNMSIQVGWVAAKGTHVFAGDGPNYNINQASIQGYSTITGPECNNSFPCTNAREPFYQQFGWTQGVQWYGNDVSDNYNSLQAVFRRRFSAGYSVTANYTWSKCFDFGGGYSEAPEGGAIAYGPCDFNRNQVLNIQNLVELPFGKGKRWANSSKALDYIVGGWQWNAVWNLQSGQPFTASYQDCGSDQDVGTCRPNLVGNAVLSNRTQNQWFTTTGGVLLSSNGQTIGPWQRPQVGQLGNTPWDSLYGPHFYEVDMSLFKNFKITEKVAGQFRAEAFNIFNVANLGQPNATVDASNAGQIQSTFTPGNIAGMRNFQFGLRFDF